MSVNIVLPSMPLLIFTTVTDFIAQDPNNYSWNVVRDL